ncbi:Ras-related protein RABA1g [Trichoplax sp. H2]|nr:Ras-related protein RABA1g [Trichoplax sp. H2]|eukprot:RDD46586.1 Ras-related protein RABA1g [Trichoplax sp. H2]
MKRLKLILVSFVPSFCLIVLLLGHSDSGKKELYSYFNKDSPKVDFISTIGVDYAVKSVKIGFKLVKAQIWDTVYQDQLKAVRSPYYFRGAAGVIFIFDVTKRHTYENIRDWLNDSYVYGDNKLVTLLIGNTSKYNEGMERAVSKTEVKFENKTSYYVETCISDTTIVEGAFQRFMAEIYRKQFVHAIENSPLKFHAPFKGIPFSDAFMIRFYEILYDTTVVLLLGDPDCEKLDLYSQFEGGNVHTDYGSTVGVDFTFRNMHIDGKIVEVQIWYITSQNRFRGLYSSYYRSAAGALLIYDVTKRHTFHNVRNWVHDMMADADENIVTLLLGNTSTCNKDNTRAVSEKEANKFAEGNVTFFSEISILDNVAIENLFRNFVSGTSIA